MGAFFLCKNDIRDIKLSNVTDVFVSKGFEQSIEFEIGEWKAFVYSKQSVKNLNYRIDNCGRVLIAVGTPIYGGMSYSDSLDGIFHDLCESRFQYKKMYGTFMLLYYNGDTVSIVLDDMCQYPVFYSKNFHLISSSFIACARGTETLHLDRMACLEKLCTGMLTGDNTYFDEIKRVVGASEYLDSVGIKVFPSEKNLFEGGKNSSNLQECAQEQLVVLNDNLKKLSNLVSEYGADMGLSGGYDSRLLYGLLAESFVSDLSVHSHRTVGAHEKEYAIATKMANVYDLKVNSASSVPFNKLDTESQIVTLDTNFYAFDGFSDSHYGTVSSNYSRNYREKVSNGHNVFFTGLSGELYRNYRKISRRVNLTDFLDTYVFYCDYEAALNTSQLRSELREYVCDKALRIMGEKNKKTVSPSFVRKYSALVRLPYKASCAAGAFSQYSFYDAPCTHRNSTEESMKADKIIGSDALLEADMIDQINHKLWEIPVTKNDSTQMGRGSFVTEFKRWFFSILPMRIIRKRKQRGQMINEVESLLKRSNDFAEAVDFTESLFVDDISIMKLLKTKNSYHNTVYFCWTISKFKNQIK